MGEDLYYRPTRGSEVRVTPSFDFNEFLPKCKVMVARHINRNLDEKRNMGVSSEEVFVVWYSKTLQNAKAILGVPGRPLLFEITYNGERKEIYLDEYEKVSNQKISL